MLRIFSRRGKAAEIDIKHFRDLIMDYAELQFLANERSHILIFNKLVETLERETGMKQDNKKLSNSINRGEFGILKIMTGDYKVLEKFKNQCLGLGITPVDGNILPFFVLYNKSYSTSSSFVEMYWAANGLSEINFEYILDLQVKKYEESLRVDRRTWTYKPSEPSTYQPYDYSSGPYSHSLYGSSNYQRNYQSNQRYGVVEDINTIRDNARCRGTQMEQLFGPKDGREYQQYLNKNNAYE